MKHEQLVSSELDSGCQLFVAPVKGSKSSFFSIGFKVGAINEKGFGKGSNDGISHFIEHMAFKSTHLGKKARDINEAFTRMGANINATTSYDRTFFYSKTPSRFFYPAIDLWSEIFHEIKLDSNDVESERQVVLQELNMKKDDPHTIIFLNALSRLFKDTPLEHNILGSNESVANISIDMMKDYIEKHYTLNNAFIVIAGSVKWPSIKNKLEESFIAETDRTLQSNQLSNPWDNMGYRRNFNQAVVTKRMKRPLTYVATAWEMPGTAGEQGLLLELICTMLGNSKTSLVYKEIVSKGIVSNLRFMAEFFVPVSAGCLKYACSPSNALEIHENVIGRVLRKARDMEITTELVKRLQDELIGEYLLQIEDPMMMGMDIVNRYIKFDETISPDDYIRRIRAITPEEVKEIINHMFDDMNFTVYTMGDIPENWEPALELEG